MSRRPTKEYARKNTIIQLQGMGLKNMGIFSHQHSRLHYPETRTKREHIFFLFYIKVLLKKHLYIVKYLNIRM